MVNQPSLESASDEPLYNIGIVSRMTGIPVATLRVWERRYGFPHSTRTPGGHRLSSEREVIRLRWVKARVDEGMQTGQAIRALQHLEQEGRLPDTPLVPTPKPHVPIADPSFSAFEEHLTQVLLNHNLVGADQLLGEILSLYPLEDLILEVVSPTLNNIGEAWHEGQISIATEHLATNYVRQHLLMWMSTGPQPYVGVPPVMLACAPEEWHEGSLMIMGVMLRRLRWPVAYLGQSVPLSDLGTLVRKMKSPGVVFVAMSDKAAEALINWPNYLPHPDGNGRPIVGFGGRIFNEEPAWREKVPGVFLGESLREGVEQLDELLRRAVSPSV
ncbi:MAG: MerR family DNA-binding transcriptional regulator [Anaerolineae bacterium]|nr:MerR family DNA-binding transcriptional regulator [Anaerolineae bacterium]